MAQTYTHASKLNQFENRKIAKREKWGRLPALHEVGGSFWRSLSSFKIRLDAIAKNLIKIQNQNQNQLRSDQIRSERNNTNKQDDRENLKTIHTFLPKVRRKRSNREREREREILVWVIGFVVVFVEEGKTNQMEWRNKREMREKETSFYNCRLWMEVTNQLSIHSFSLITSLSFPSSPFPFLSFPFFSLLLWTALSFSSNNNSLLYILLFSSNDLIYYHHHQYRYYYFIFFMGRKEISLLLSFFLFCFYSHLINYIYISERGGVWVPRWRLVYENPILFFLTRWRWVSKKES